MGRERSLFLQGTHGVNLDDDDADVIISASDVGTPHQQVAGHLRVSLLQHYILDTLVAFLSSDSEDLELLTAENGRQAVEVLSAVLEALVEWMVEIELVTEDEARTFLDRRPPARETAG